MANRRAILPSDEANGLLKAAKAAGYDYVTLTVEAADGRKLQLVAGKSAGGAGHDGTPYGQWKASHAS